MTSDPAPKRPSSNSASSSAEEIYLEFADAAERRTSSEFQSAFEALCAAHPAHAAELRRLRKLEGVVKQMLESGPSFFRPDSAPAPDAAHRAGDLARSLEPGAILGDFRLERFLGQGGMGQVWQAQQVSMRRNVALKFLLPGRADERMIALFEREARAGGRANHPNLVRTLARGETDGIEWIAQELVEGSFSLRDAIERFRREPVLPRDYYRRCASLVQAIAQGLQAAHDAGVIHRDLKPQNILLDSRDTPRVADFGLARIEGDTVLSKSGDVVGTYQYMSPEQVSAVRSQIDHRTDIFSLGVVLYELLTLQRPFNGDTTNQIASQIASFDPPEPSKLRTQCPRDLSVIALKALQKRPAARYATMREFAEDLGRFLRHEAILAQPATKLEAVRKWVLRNPAPSMGMAVGAVALAVISGIAIYARAQATEANLQAGRADERAVAAKLAENKERERAAQLKMVSDFQAAMLEQIDVTRAGSDLVSSLRERFSAAMQASRLPDGQRVALIERMNEGLSHVNATDLAAVLIDRTILMPAVRALDERFDNDKATGSKLRRTLANSYIKIGKYELAHLQHLHALAMRSEELGPTHPDTLESMSDVAIALRYLDRESEAEPIQREALRLQRELLGSDAESTLTSVSRMGVILFDIGRVEEAEPLYREALEGRRKALGPDHPQTLISLANLGGLLESQGKLEAAERYLAEALEARRRSLGEDHPDSLRSLFQMALLRESQGMSSDAETRFREVADRCKAVLGEDHPQTLDAVSKIGYILESQGRNQEAEDCWREVLDRRERVLGCSNTATLKSAKLLAWLMTRLDRFVEAEAMLMQALEWSASAPGEWGIRIEIMEDLALNRSKLGAKLDAEFYYRLALHSSLTHLGELHDTTLAAVNNLKHFLDSAGRTAEAEFHFRQHLMSLRCMLGDEAVETRRGMYALGNLLAAQCRVEESVSILREELALCRRIDGDHDAGTISSLFNLGRILRRCGYIEEAEAYYVEAFSLRLQHLGPMHPDTLEALKIVGVLNFDLGRHGEAERIYRGVLESMLIAFGPNHASTIAARRNLARLLSDLGRHFEAEPYYLELLQTECQLLGGDHPDTLKTIHSMGFGLTEQGRLMEAEAYYEEALAKRTSMWGLEHPATLASLCNMAFLQETQGDLLYSERLSRLEVENSAKVLGERHMDTITAIHRLSRVLMRLRKYEESEALATRAWNLRKDVLGELHASTLSSISLLSEVRLRQGKVGEAHELLTAVNDDARFVLESDSIELARYLSIFGQVRTSTSRDLEGYMSAERDLLRAFRIFSSHVLASKHDLGQCIRALAELYDGWSRDYPLPDIEFNASIWKSRAARQEVLDMSGAEPAK